MLRLVLADIAEIAALAAFLMFIVSASIAMGAL